MPKYHLVSDVLQDLGSDIGELGWASLLNVINEEWANGKLKLLRVRPELAKPEVWEPAGRTLTIDITSGKRWIKCAICSRNDRGGAVTDFERPHISDEDVQYIKQMVAAIGLVPAEQS